MPSYSIYDRLLRRELGDRRRKSTVRGLYGDRKWIHDLDIVNELDGHSGCVNTLSWSKSGKLLASGSDDQHLNIHAYQPIDSTKPFSLTTTVATGHRANIFSVKFMPHSNDRILVTAAGDSEIRIFDLEHSASSTASSANDVYLRQGTKFMNEADTNAKVYRSHSDRVKRIVTENSPYLFLSCSEDGEVRQWDLRQPSSYYPRARSPWTRFSSRSDDVDPSSVPPPLISYKRHRLDLNTISCSASQPFYIALGGAHPHCFLHDRRMLGRDKALERGDVPAVSASQRDEDHMGFATQCVRRFAPSGNTTVKRNDNGHITACKISDARPNEMVVSWSGDHIYAFNLTKPEEASSISNGRATATQEASNRARESRDRKRKRALGGSSGTSEGDARASSTPRLPGSTSGRSKGMALRVNYQNGQSENIPIQDDAPQAASANGDASAADIVTDQASWIAAKVVDLQLQIFVTARISHARKVKELEAWRRIIALAHQLLSAIDNVCRRWRYPVNPSEEDVALQNGWRETRRATRKFVQACGVVARVLEGHLRTGANRSSSQQPPQSEEPTSSLFSKIVPAPNERTIKEDSEIFAYDFLKAILLWLDSGSGAVVENFTYHPGRGSPDRYPIPRGLEGIEAIDEFVIPTFQRHAGPQAILDMASSSFEHDESRRLYNNQSQAVEAFARDIKIPFEDLSQSSYDVDTPSVESQGQKRSDAIEHWAGNVARGMLVALSRPLTFAAVDFAFGGESDPSPRTLVQEARLKEQFDVGETFGVIRNTSDSDSDASIDEEALVESVALTTDSAGGLSAEGLRDAYRSSEARAIPQRSRRSEARAAGDTEEIALIEQIEDDLAAIFDIQRDDQSTTTDEDSAAVDDEDEEESSPDDDNDSDVNEAEADENAEEYDDEEEEEEEDSSSSASAPILRAALSRPAARERVHASVPCSAPFRGYRGHCNVKTVKDVNYFGLDDEYVVSGSDSGHLFVWAAGTGELLNVLEADGEVVNVVTGHPHEPLLATSGIDSTIKIFSPDARARQAARRGYGVARVDTAQFSSLHYGGRRRSRAPQSTRVRDDPSRNESSEDDSEDVEAEVARVFGGGGGGGGGAGEARGRGLPSCRRRHQRADIVAQNEASRRGGNREAFITRSMLAELAHRVQMQQMGIRVEGADGAAGDDCVVM